MSGFFHHLAGGRYHVGDQIVCIDDRSLAGFHLAFGQLDHAVGKVGKKVTDGVLLAHTDGDVPNMYVTLPEQDAFTLGYTIYFFELAIALSGYLNAINPFDQPGVEAYKRNMFALLGKPGFEELSKELNARL